MQFTEIFKGLSSQVVDSSPNVEDAVEKISMLLDHQALKIYKLEQQNTKLIETLEYIAKTNVHTKGSIELKLARCTNVAREALADVRRGDD